MQEQSQQRLLRHGLCEEKRFKTAERHRKLESTPRPFSKGCTHCPVQTTAHHMLRRKTSLTTKIFSCSQEIYRTQRKSDK